METYILDANIVIKLWDEKPEILDAIDEHNELEYRVTQEVALELVQGEQDKFFPNMDTKYQKLMEHLIATPGQLPDKPFKENRYLQSNGNKLSFVIGNKVSSPDYLMILLCQNQTSYRLVTNDTKMLKSAKLVLKDNRIFNYQSFLLEMDSKNVL